MGYTSGGIAIPTDREGDGWSSCSFSIRRLPDGRLEVTTDRRVAFYMPDARNTVEAIRRAAQQFADDAGLSRWDASVKLRDDLGDACGIDYWALHVLADALRHRRTPAWG